MEFFIDALKNFATFSGRANRQQYWMFVLFYTLIYVALVLVDFAIGTGGMLALLFSFVVLVPSIAVATRRLHDTGRTGWWQLIIFIPLIGLIVLIIFLAQPSDGDNPYGTAP